ncbi:uncharacterized protein LOC143677784 isoform X2 [Tamandua tetradactyla]|uniref:uncharacterized protein LOC143677784 isoform X2 n=1 Tax=Tamandua tetradactyla TaxID=48850 RepID=UPI004053B460
MSPPAAWSWEPVAAQAAARGTRALGDPAGLWAPAHLLKLLLPPPQLPAPSHVRFGLSEDPPGPLLFSSSPSSLSSSSSRASSAARHFCLQRPGLGSASCAATQKQHGDQNQEPRTPVPAGGRIHSGVRSFSSPMPRERSRGTWCPQPRKSVRGCSSVHKGQEGTPGDDSEPSHQRCHRASPVEFIQTLHQSCQLHSLPYGF